MIVKLPGRAFGRVNCDDGETSQEVLFGSATCDGGQTSRKCCLALLLAMMVKLPGSVVWPCYLRCW